MSLIHDNTKGAVGGSRQPLLVDGDIEPVSGFLRGIGRSRILDFPRGGDSASLGSFSCWLGSQVVSRPKSGLQLFVLLIAERQLFVGESRLECHRRFKGRKGNLHIHQPVQDVGLFEGHETGGLAPRVLPDEYELLYTPVGFQDSLCLSYG